MKTEAFDARKLASLLKKVGTAGDASPAAAPGDDPVAVLVMSLLLWESTTEKALAAYERLMNHAVDFNDLRVSMPHELIDWMGSRYPLAEERARRLRAALRSIYVREHAVTLAPLKAQGKRDVRKYMEAVEGLPPYALSRTLLLGFDAHAVPVDNQLRDALADAGACPPDADIVELTAWMTQQVKAADGVAVHHGLQRWVEQRPSKSSRGGSERKTTSRKTTRKTSSAKAG